ncbi:galactose-1-epimerase [Photobacterium japonica]|uniref:galactose-1-epimerase n=1 Tax=Photobacterium japonica TaxID=2910235 RepID=UPI003D0B32AC
MTLPLHLAGLYDSMRQDRAADGQPANLYTLSNTAGMTATFMDIGATWISCTLPVADEQREVVLGCRTLADYQKQSAYMGATVGRYANRLEKGQFTVDGTKYQVAVNQAGNTLHGGPDGFHQRRWTVQKNDASQVVFSLVSEHGDQGFPGQLTASVTFTLTEDNALVIAYEAECDQACPVNLTNHAYFNLAGAESGHECLSHTLTIAAEAFVPTDEVGIPTGEWTSVVGTGFDFQEAKTIRQDFLADDDQRLAGGYDHAFVLLPTVTDGHTMAMQAVSPDHDVTLSVMTTKPAVQLYTGNFLEGNPAREGIYHQFDGFCLETEYLPDAPNHPEWPEQGILAVGERYQHNTTYQFSIAKR